MVFLGAVTTNTSVRSSANLCRSLGILFLVYSINSLTTRFDRKGERIPLCGQPILTAVVHRSPCSSTVVCRLWIIELIHWLTSVEIYIFSPKLKALFVALKDMLSKNVPSAIPAIAELPRLKPYYFLLRFEYILRSTSKRHSIALSVHFSGTEASVMVRQDFSL